MPGRVPFWGLHPNHRAEQRASTTSSDNRRLLPADQAAGPRTRTRTRHARTVGHRYPIVHLSASWAFPARHYPPAFPW
eukprot:260924-Chlamydomonas_euryale.AAC.1